MGMVFTHGDGRVWGSISVPIWPLSEESYRANKKRGRFYRAMHVVLARYCSLGRPSVRPTVRLSVCL